MTWLSRSLPRLDCRFPIKKRQRTSRGYWTVVARGRPVWMWKAKELCLSKLTVGIQFQSLVSSAWMQPTATSNKGRASGLWVCLVSVNACLGSRHELLRSRYAKRLTIYGNVGSEPATFSLGSPRPNRRVSSIPLLYGVRSGVFWVCLADHRLVGRGVWCCELRL